MTDKEVVESLDNAWRALSRRYQKCPDEGLRQGLNLLGQTIYKVRSEVEESHRETQITIEEWLEVLQKRI